MEQTVHPVGLDCRQHRRMDRSNRPRMTAGKGDQVLVGLLHRAEPLAQVGYCPFLEGDHRRHRH